MTPKERIAQRLGVEGPTNYFDPPIAVSLEDFFDGNPSEGSIGCNVIPPPGLARFRAVLDALRAGAGVENVWVLVTLWDEPDWPFSDHIAVATTLSNAEIAEAIEELQPDEVFDLSPEVARPLPASVGHRLIGVWWD